jgi:D-alanyl-D-alanine carboxypeptidase
MDYVSSLAGTLFSSKGKNLQFVIMINNKSSTAVSKDLFRERARKIQDDLLELWWHEN